MFTLLKTDDTNYGISVIEAPKKVQFLKCEDCGIEAEDVHETTCPFAEEIYGEVVEVTLCDDCKMGRAYDT